ncbi:MAG TPA: inorganic diphosphatase [Symbiobacteriaceae bacterium]|jgi:inorganic pyrophosphatase
MGPNEVDVLVEIPRGSQNKYVWDPIKRRVRLDRVLHASIHYPADYGIIPDTMSPDGSPVDVLLLVTNPTFPGCMVTAKVIGCLKTLDEGLEDLKIIAVPATDPRLSAFNRLEEIPPHLLKEIEYFFAAYKDLEDKQVEIQGWGDAAEAMGAVRHMQRAAAR